MENTLDQDYVPGVCNIGVAERNRRKQLGWIGIILTFAGLLIFDFLVINHDLHPFFGFILVLPAFLAAIGMLQSQQQFCVAFGLTNVYNFKPTIGPKVLIENKDARNTDRKIAIKMIIQSIILSLIIGVIAVVTGFMLA